MTDPQQHPSTEQFPSATPPTDPAVHTRALPYAGDAPAEQTPTPRRRRGARAALVAAAAVGLVAVGGGGFAIGRATAPDTAATSSTTDQQFPDGGQLGTPPDGGQFGTPPDGGQFGIPPGQDGTTDDGTATDGTTSDPTT